MSQSSPRIQIFFEVSMRIKKTGQPQLRCTVSPRGCPWLRCPGSLQRIEWFECVTSAPQAWDEFLYGDLTGLDLSGKKVCWRRELRLLEETQSGIREQLMP